MFLVTVAGTNITTTLMPVLISLTVSDKVGTHSDTASLEVDDTEGRIILPQIGAPVIVALGWEGEGVPSEGNFLSFFWVVLCHISILISLLVQWLTESRFGKTKFGFPIEIRSLMYAGISCTGRAHGIRD